MISEYPVIGAIVLIGLLVLLWSKFGWFNLRRALRRRAFGGARWAKLRDVMRAGLTSGKGLFLGHMKGRDLSHNDEGHLMTIGGAGGGKSAALVVPALLELTEGSIVVTDPSGELAAITRRHRETIGPVVLLNPFQSVFEADTGLDLPDAGFNPLSVLDPKSDSFVTDCAAIARLLCVTDRKESGTYFQDEGAEFLALIIAAVVMFEDKDLHTLTFLYQLVRDTSENILQRLEWIEDEQHPALRDDAARFADIIRIAKPQWAGIVSKAALATKRYAPSTPLGVHVEKDGFDASTLKQDNVTVYLLVPSSMLPVALPWMNLLIGVFGGAVGKPGKAQPVTLLIDEAPAIGYLPDLRTFMAQFRKVGLRVWIFTQTAAALESEDLYGKTGFKELMGICSIKQFFSIREPEVAQMISDLCGQRTVSNVSASETGANVGDVGQPLIRPDEVRGLRKYEQILIVDTLQSPIRAKLRPYFKRKKWAAMTDPNPYRKDLNV